MNSLFNSLKTSLSKNIGPNASQPSDDDPAASLPTAPSQIDDNSVLAPNPISTADNNEKQQEKSVRPAELANKFFGMAVKASTKLQQKAANLSTIVNEKTLIGNIEKERLKFIGELQKEKGPKEAGALSLLLANPEAQKHIISISAEAKNFTEEPPLTFDLESDIEEIKTCANELFTLDPRLKEIRFALVPKQVTEEKFWRNYAYKLSLVKKVLDQKPIAPKEEITRSTKDEDDLKMGTVNTERKESTEDEQETLEKELLNDLDDYEVVNGGAKKEDDKLDDELNKEIDALLGDGNSK